MSGGKITSQNCTAYAAPRSSGRTKQAIVIVGNAHAKNIAVIAEDRRLAGKTHGGISAGRRDVNKWHSASDSCRHRAKIKIHGPIRVRTYVDAGGVQASHANRQVAFQGLLEESSSIVHRRIKSHQETACGCLHSQRLGNHIKRTATAAAKSDGAIYDVVGIPVFG